MLSPWVKSIVLSLALIAAWILLGTILSVDSVKEIIPKQLRVLDKGSTLTYASMALAVQIPLFILFIQQMANAGDINRKRLPYVTQFREILSVFIVGGALLLISPRESFLYIPAFVLFCTNVFALYRAVTVLFQTDIYEKPIKNHLSKTVEKSLNTLLDKRTNNKKFFEDVNNVGFIEFSYLERDNTNDKTKTVELRAPTGGYIEEIDIQGLTNLLNREFGYTRGRLSTTAQTSMESYHLLLRVHPFMKINNNNNIAKLTVPKEYEKTDRLLKQLEKFFKISTETEDEPEIKSFDDLFNEFEEQLNKAIKERDTLLLAQTFELLNVFLDEFDASTQAQIQNDEGYTLEEAMKELTRFPSDDFSSRVFRLYELLSDLLSKALRDDQPDISRELIRFIYGKKLDASETLNLTSIARAERLTLHAAGLFIYSNSWNKNLSLSQKELRADIIFKIKEGTSLIVYKLSDFNKNQNKNNARILELWIEYRIIDIRRLLMDAYKKNLESIFDSLLEAIQEVDKESSFRELSDETYKFARCNIFLLAAYIKHREDLETHFGKKATDIISKWSPQEQLNILIECSKQDYADKWRINTHDHLADGQVREVPNYNKVMKLLWVDIMLEAKSFPKKVEHYNKRLLQETLLFTEGKSSEKDNELLKILNDSKHPKANDLKELVNNFIKIRFEWEANKLAQERLDQEKVNEFKSDVNKEYLETSVANKVFDISGNSITKTSVGKRGYLQIGINQIFDKEAFIADWHIGFAMDYFGKDLGREIAQEQDKKILSQLLENAEQFKKFHLLLSRVKKRKSKDWLVLAANIGSWEVRREIDSYIDEKSSTWDEIYIKDIGQSLPMHVFYNEDIYEGLYFVPMDRIGKLTRKKTEEGNLIEVNVDAYSENESLLKDILESPPEWLRKMGDEANQKAFLRKKVRLFVKHVFKYEPPKEKEALFIPIKF